MQKISSQKETSLTQKNGRRPVSGFTLVELIVVITILAILGTIAIMAFSGYSKNARDSARISDLSNIKKSLELWILQSGTYPDPSDASDISYSGGLVWSQGTFGESVYNTVGKLDKKPKDPLYDVDYTYSVTQSKKEYQIGAVLEGQTAYTPITQTYAASQAKAYILGTYNGVLATTNTTPVYILALPSIILSDINDAELKATTVSLSYEGKDNLPSSYNDTSLTMTGTNFTFTPIEVWSGTTIKDLNDQTEFQLLVANLQDTYKGDTSFSNLPEYNSIAQTSDFSITAMSSIKALVEINTGEELTKVATTPVFNDCDFNGTTILNGNSVTAYLTGSVAYGNTCTSQQRTCNNAVLSGTYTNATCTVASPLNCTFNGNQVTHGNSVTAYLTSSIPYGNTCTSEQRTCTNANLSGTYTNATCSPLPPTGTFTLSQTSVVKGTNVTITNNCSVAPTSYTSSNTGIATISGTTITTLSGGTTNITPVGGACGDSAVKVLTVTEPVCGTYTVSAGGYTYNTILGPNAKCRTSSNMKHGTYINGATTPTLAGAERWCYNNTASNCTSQGGLYNGYEASVACIDLGTGWHLPSNTEWNSLTSAGATGWTGNKLSGIVSTLPGYLYSFPDYFGNQNARGQRWSSTPSATGGYGYSYFLTSGSSTVSSAEFNLWSYGFSVVCVK